MLIDYHLHTNYSDDSDYLMEDLVKDAIRMGLDEICFTDHVDYGIKLDWNQVNLNEVAAKKTITNVDYPKYNDEIDYLKTKYQDQIIIKKGLEFGVQTHTIKPFKKLFDSYDFDFIILSCHQVNDKEFWTNDFQNGKTQDEYNQEYYQEIYRVIKEYKDYSVLGHLDMIKRYDSEGDYPFDKYKDIVTKILKMVIADGKGIEINTSSHRYQLDDLTPSMDILRLYRDLGGKIVTIGSDTHVKEHLGAYIEQSKQILKDLGFKYYCTFEKMNPIYNEL